MRELLHGRGGLDEYLERLHKWHSAEALRAKRRQSRAKAKANAQQTGNQRFQLHTFSVT